MEKDGFAIGEHKASEWLPTQGVFSGDTLQHGEHGFSSVIGVVVEIHSPNSRVTHNSNDARNQESILLIMSLFLHRAWCTNDRTIPRPMDHERQQSQ